MVVKPLHPPGTENEFKASSFHCCSSPIRQCFSTSELTSFNLLSAHLCQRAGDPGLSLGLSWLDFTFTCFKLNDTLFYQQNIKTSLKSTVLCLLCCCGFFFMHIWNSLQAKRKGAAVPCGPQLNKSCCFGAAMARCQNTINWRTLKSWQIIHVWSIPYIISLFVFKCFPCWPQRNILLFLNWTG